MSPLRPARLDTVTPFGIDQVAATAGEDPSVLRMENLDTDLAPPPGVIEATRAAVGSAGANSYLPFIGWRSLREAIAGRLEPTIGHAYDPETQVVVTAGGTEGLLAALLAVIDPGDEVVLTDPTYAGMIHRVTLAGGIPRFVPLLASSGGWRLDLDALEHAAGPRTRALFLMSPSMPSGAVLHAEEWQAVCGLCRERDLWLIYNAAMERILFGDAPHLNPAALEGMAERTLVVGSVSKEYRMIGWRIGWVAGPAEVMRDVVWTHTYTVVTPPGIGQAGAEAALRSPAAEVEDAARILQQRRDALVSELAGWPLVVPDGGWSLLVDAAAMGLSPQELSRRLLAQARGGDCS
jgi:aspartate/methionine/tyrosine aminotransferase